MSWKEPDLHEIEALYAAYRHGHISWREADQRIQTVLLRRTGGRFPYWAWRQPSVILGWLVLRVFFCTRGRHDVVVEIYAGRRRAVCGVCGTVVDRT